jgi:Flp pilus assembly protein TadD
LVGYELEPSLAEVRTMLIKRDEAFEIAMSSTEVASKIEAIKGHREPGESDEANVLFSKAFTSFQSGKFADAVELFVKGLELSPASPAAHFYIAESYDELQRFDKAGQHYRIAMELKPESKEAKLARTRLGLRKTGQ